MFCSMEILVLHHVYMYVRACALYRGLVQAKVKPCLLCHFLTGSQNIGAVGRAAPSHRYYAKHTELS